MDIAALVAWLVTALGGFQLLRTWIARGGIRQQQSGTSRLPAPVVLGHFALAAVGLVVWIAYLATDTSALAWTAFVILLPVALLGFVMLARWIPVRRAGSGSAATAASATAATGSAPGVTTATAAPAAADERTVPAERHFRPAVVLGHGLLAVATLVLVLLGALGVGGS